MKASRQSHAPREHIRGWIDELNDICDSGLLDDLALSGVYAGSDEFCLFHCLLDSFRQYHVYDEINVEIMERVQ